MKAMAPLLLLVMCVLLGSQDGDARATSSPQRDANVPVTVPTTSSPVARRVPSDHTEGAPKTRQLLYGDPGEREWLHEAVLDCLDNVFAGGQETDPGNMFRILSRSRHAKLHRRVPLPVLQQTRRECTHCNQNGHQVDESQTVGDASSNLPSPTENPYIVPGINGQNYHENANLQGGNGCTNIGVFTPNNQYSGLNNGFQGYNPFPPAFGSGAGLQRPLLPPGMGNFDQGGVQTQPGCGFGQHLYQSSGNPFGSAGNGPQTGHNSWPFVRDANMMHLRNSMFPQPHPQSTPSDYKQPRGLASVTINTPDGALDTQCIEHSGIDIVINVGGKPDGSKEPGAKNCPCHDQLDSGHDAQNVTQKGHTLNTKAADHTEECSGEGCKEDKGGDPAIVSRAGGRRSSEKPKLKVSEKADDHDLVGRAYPAGKEQTVNVSVAMKGTSREDESKVKNLPKESARNSDGDETATSGTH